VKVTPQVLDLLREAAKNPNWSPTPERQLPPQVWIDAARALALGFQPPAIVRERMLEMRAWDPDWDSLPKEKP